MNYVWVYVLPLAILAMAAGLYYWQAQAWRRAQHEADIGAGDALDFGHRQFRRRTQTTFMLALLALGMCLGQLIPRSDHPTLFVLFWFGMLLLLAWIVLLALGDLVIGRQHVAQLVRERRMAEAQLNAELDRLRGVNPERQSDRTLQQP